MNISCVFNTVLMINFFFNSRNEVASSSMCVGGDDMGSAIVWEQLPVQWHSRGSQHATIIMEGRILSSIKKKGEHRGRDRMVVGFTTTCVISPHHH